MLCAEGLSIGATAGEFRRLSGLIRAFSSGGTAVTICLIFQSSMLAWASGRTMSHDRTESFAATRARIMRFHPSQTSLAGMRVMSSQPNTYRGHMPQHATPQHTREPGNSDTLITLTYFSGDYVRSAPSFVAKKQKKQQIIHPPLPLVSSDGWCCCCCCAS